MYLDIPVWLLVKVIELTYCIIGGKVQEAFPSLLLDPKAAVNDTRKTPRSCCTTAAVVTLSLNASLIAPLYFFQPDITSFLSPFLFSSSFTALFFFFFLLCNDKSGWALHQISYAFTSFFHACLAQWELGTAKDGSRQKWVGFTLSEYREVPQTQWKQGLDLFIFFQVVTWQSIVKTKSLVLFWGVFKKRETSNELFTLTNRYRFQTIMKFHLERKHPTTF